MDNIYSNLGIPLQDQKILKKYSILKKIDDAINNIQKDYGYTEKERNLLFMQRLLKELVTLTSSTRSRTSP